MNIGDTFELSIHEKHLNTGVHEYMVWFDATCEVIPGLSPPSVELQVDCDMPNFAHQPHRRGPCSNPVLTANMLGLGHQLGPPFEEHVEEQGDSHDFDLRSSELE